MAAAMRVCVLGDSSDLARRIASQYEVTAIDLDDAPAGDCEGVVIVVGADPAPTSQPLADMSETEWRAAAENVPLRVMRAMQRARTAILAKCGNVVLVTPSVGLVGAQGLSHYVTGIEAVRAMAKSAARQWATDRIGVSLVVVPLGLIAVDAGELVPHVGRGARKDADLAEATLRAVDFVLSGAGPALTGATLVVDGGAVMVP